MEAKAVFAPSKGITKYYPGNLIDDGAWSDGNNVQFGVGYVKKVNGWLLFTSERASWTANTQYGFSETPAGGSASLYVVPQNTQTNKHVYSLITPGFSGLTEPTWPTARGGTVTDGTAVWQEVGESVLTGTLQAIDNFYRRDDVEWLMFVTTRRVYYYDKTPQTFVDITGATDLDGDVEHPVATENAADYFVLTNGKDPVKYWDGEMTAIADLPGLTDCEPGPEGTPVTSVKAKCLSYWNNFLILGDTTENGTHRPQRIRWSKLGEVAVWKNDAEGNGEAGCADISEGVDWVQAIRALGSYLVVYKERSIQVLSYVGGEQIWDRRPAIIGTGLLAPHALCDLGDEHIFVGPDNFYSFDGIEPKIAGDDVAKEFFRIMDPARSVLTGSFFIEEVPEIWFPFVSIDSHNGLHDRAVVYNTDTKAWSWRDAPMLAYGYYYRNNELKIDDMNFTIDSWDEQIDSSVNLANSPVNLCGDANGVIFELRGNSFNGADIVSSLTSKLFDLDAPSQIKRLLRIQLMISREGPYNLPIYVGTADNVDEDVVFYGPYNMSLSKTYPPWVDMDISSRYFCIKLGTVLKDEPFTLSGYILHYELRGEV